MKLRFQNIFLGSFPALILLLVIPLSIYCSNQEEFNYSISLLCPFILCALVWVCVVCVFTYVRKFNDSKLFVCLFYFGIFLIMKDVIAPIESIGLIGLDDNIVVYEPFRNILFELILLAVIFLCFKKTPVFFIRSKILPVFVLFVTINFCISAKDIDWGKIDYNETVASKNRVKRFETQSKNIKNGNVYLLCLDGSIGRAFLDVLEKGELADDFNDFVYFINNKTNYTFTWPSIASSLSGSFYEKGSMKDFITKGRLEGGLLQAFKEKGYSLWMYSGYKHESVESEYFVSPLKRNVSRFHKSYLFGSFWLLRIAPTMIKQEILFKVVHQNKKYRIAVSSFIVESLDNLNKFVDEEYMRPLFGQFVFLHAYIPHPPYIFNKDCEEGFLNDGYSYIGQAACSLRPVARWIEQLKTEGKFDSSTIIIFGDHGGAGKGTREIYADIKTSEKFKNTIKRIGCKTPRQLELWSSSLLLVKPPQNRLNGTMSKKMEISYCQTQNGDIAATLEDLTGVNVNDKIGVSVFSQNFPTEREVDVFDGFGKTIYKKIKKYGENSKFIEGILYHFKYSNRSGWKYVGEIECTW